MIARRREFASHTTHVRRTIRRRQQAVDSCAFKLNAAASIECNLETRHRHHNPFRDGRMSGAVIYLYVIRVEEQESDSGGGASDDLGHQVNP